MNRWLVVVALLVARPAAAATDPFTQLRHLRVRGGLAVAASCVNHADRSAGGPTGCYLDLTGVPPGAVIVDAWMYWSSIAPFTPVTPGAPVFLGTPVVPVQIGLLPETPCFDAQSFTAAFRADVTSLVVGDGRYPVSGFVSTGTQDGVVTEGATLVVLYSTPNCAEREIVVYDGLDVVNPSRPDFRQVVSGFTAPPSGPTVATVAVVAGNGQVMTPDYDDPFFFNGADMTAFHPDILSGGLCLPSGLYDRTVLDVSNIVTPSSTSAIVEIGYAGDCYTVSAVALSVDLLPPIDALIEPSALDLRPTAAPLLVSKLGTLTLLLSWEDVSASGYQLWRGHVGSFYDHYAEACELTRPFAAVPVGTTSDYFLAVTSGCGGSTSDSGRDSRGRTRPSAGVASGRPCP